MAINKFKNNLGMAYYETFVISIEERRLFGVIDMAFMVANMLHGINGGSPTCHMPHFFLTFIPIGDKEKIASYFFSKVISFGQAFAAANGIKKLKRVEIDQVEVIFPANFRVPGKYLPVRLGVGQWRDPRPWQQRT